MIKQEKGHLLEKNKEFNEEIVATKKELSLLMQTNSEKIRKINDLLQQVSAQITSANQSIDKDWHFT